jgi:histidinol-phosphate phosphatase family protein
MALRTALDQPRQLIILAGGKGTRLAGQLERGTPKPMALVAGRPLLEIQIELAKRTGFEDIRLLTSYRSEVIEAYFGDGSRFGVRIGYHVDAEPRGTAGAVLEALPELADRFALLYGDTLLDVDLDRFWRRHVEVEADCSLFIHPNDHPQDSDLIDVDDSQWIRAFHPHPHAEGRYLKNMVNAALYIIEKRALQPFSDRKEKLDFAHDLFPEMLAADAKLYGYHSREYIKDMGTPERLERVEADFVSGLVEKKSLRHACPAVFLDRDGTLNVEVNRVSRADQLELIDGAGRALRRFNRAGLLTIGVTNQPVIARGDCSEDELRKIHDKLETLLGDEGAYLDALYHCPHHPDGGFSGERAELKVRCQCRKPGIALIEEASKEFFVDLPHSWFIGDTTTDLQTASNAGLRSILVRTGHAGRDGRWPARADYEFPDLDQASQFLTEIHPALLDQARTRLPSCPPGVLLALGGLARTGKSTWASLFREVLRERGQRAIIIPLDAWLRSRTQRESGHFLNRYDVDAITSLASRLVERSESVEVRLGRYDRRTRVREAEAMTLTIDRDDVVIFEGVPALAIDQLLAACSSSFYVECPETLRRERFEQEYQLRGDSDSEIEALYREREEDEHPFVKVSAAAAEFKIGSPA